MTYFLLTAFGKDRPGVVASVTRALYDAGANIEDASMTRVGGEFTMMLVAALASPRSATALARALKALKRKQIDTSLKPIPARLAFGGAHDAPGVMISVYGTDKPGIVHAVAQRLAKKKVNITDLNTRVISRSGAVAAGVAAATGPAPLKTGSGPALYIMMLEVRLPAGLSVDNLRGELDALKKQLGVDLTLHDIESVPL